MDDDDLSWGMTFYKYRVPHEGGSFQCTTNAIMRFPMLAEMANEKMIGTFVLDKWNYDCICNNELTVGGGSIILELNQIQYSRSMMVSICGGYGNATKHLEVLISITICAILTLWLLILLVYIVITLVVRKAWRTKLVL